MAGEPDRPELVAAVSNAGGLGSLACAYDPPDRIATKIAAVRALTDKPFAVNLFIPTPMSTGPDQIERAKQLLELWRDRYRLSDGPETLTMPDFEAQLAAVSAARPAVFSFTFGVLPTERVAALKRIGMIVAGTATTVAEAQRLEVAGVDLVVAQGSEAGAHRGSFLAPPPESLVGLMALVPAMVDSVRVPVVAAGGIMDGRGIAAALMLGAAGVQLGTAFLVSDESGAPSVWKQAICDSEVNDSAVTRIYSGRHARGLRNGLMTALEPYAADLPDFPAMNGLTRAIRGAASRQGDSAAMSLWAGQGAPLARRVAAGALMRMLTDETSRRLSEG
jgi:nitronate monooxygenase